MQKLLSFFDDIVRKHAVKQFGKIQGGEGEVVGQLSCIYETITTKILKKLKKILFNFLNFQTKINLEKKIPSKRKIPLIFFLL